MANSQIRRDISTGEFRLGVAFQQLKHIDYAYFSSQGWPVGIFSPQHPPSMCIDYSAERISAVVSRQGASLSRVPYILVASNEPYILGQRNFAQYKIGHVRMTMAKRQQHKQAVLKAARN